MMTGETILAIDTDSETTQKIAAILESEDYLVFTAPSGDVGITMAKKVSPKLIFVNPAMGGASGLEICKTIHGMETLKDVPIVILSAFEGTMDPRYASIYGIIDSIKKPFTPEELISKTKNVLSKEHFAAQPSAAYPGGLLEESQELSAVGEDTFAIDAGKDVEDTEMLEKTLVKPKKEIDLSDKTIVKQPKKTAQDKKAELIEEIISEKLEEKPAGRERAYVLKKRLRRTDMRGIITLIIILVVIITIVAGGFVLYKKGLLPWIKPQQPVTAKPVQPSAPQQPVPAIPAQEQQKPQLPALAPAPVPGHAPKPAPAPAPAPKPDVKKPGKEIYSVQVGAFKSSNNAELSVKNYKEKGYEAFLQKSVQKNKEIIYRVLIGKFENNKEAAGFASSLRSKEKIKAIVYKE